MALTSLPLATKYTGDLLFIKLVAVALFISITRAVVSKIHGYLYTRGFKAKHGCQPIRQFPLKDPLLGLDFMISSIKAFKENRFLETLSDRFRSVGYTFSVRGLNRRIIFTADPENIKTIMSLRFNDFALSGRQGLMGPLLGKGIFTTDGNEWAHSRAFLRPYFAKNQLADLTLFETHLGHLFSMLPKDASTVDMSDLLQCFTLDSATEFLFGRSTNTLTNATEVDIQFANSLKFSVNQMAFQMVVGPMRRFYKNNPAYVEANKVCRAYVDHFVSDVMAIKPFGAGDQNLQPNDTKPRKKSFLRDLAMVTDDKDKIRSELLSLLLAGRDTTAALLSNLIYQFARRPDVWNKLQEEAKQFKGELPTYQGLRNLKYAKYCINEALRAYPPVVVSAKVAVRDTVLPHGGGSDGNAPVFVPKGRKVLYSFYAMQRNKKIYGEDADEFRPERWENLRVTWEYLPFNGGPRTCLGQQYVITEALYVIIRFAQHFKHIDARDNNRWTECLGLTASPANVLVGFHRQLPVETDMFHEG